MQNSCEPCVHFGTDDEEYPCKYCHQHEKFDPKIKTTDPCECKSCEMSDAAMVAFNSKSDYARIMEIATQLDRDYESLKADNAELSKINQRLEAEYSLKIVELTARNDFYRRMLQDIIAVGESDSNFPQDGRMYDIAKAALEI